MRAYDLARLDAEDFPPWSTADAMTFLQDRCNLSAKLPGFAVENHGELFGLWRDAIAAGTLTRRSRSSTWTRTRTWAWETTGTCT